MHPVRVHEVAMAGAESPSRVMRRSDVDDRLLVDAGRRRGAVRWEGKEVARRPKRQAWVCRPRKFLQVRIIVTLSGVIDILARKMYSLMGQRGRPYCEDRVPVSAFS